MLFLHRFYNMKRLIYLFIGLGLMQTATAQRQFGIKAGYNYSTASVTWAGVPQPNFYKSGFGIGVLYKMPFDGVIHFSPYIAYNVRGYRHTLNTGPISEYDNTISYLDIVPSLSADFVHHHHSIVISAGPEVGFALSGTEKTISGGVVTTQKMHFATDADYGIADLGLSTSIGYHTGHIFIEAGYQIGFANINNNIDVHLPNFSGYTDPRNIRNRMFSLNIGYFLWNEKVKK